MRYCRDSFDMKIFRYIIFDKFKSFMSHQVMIFSNIFFYQVIHTDYPMTLSNKKIAEVGAGEILSPVINRFLPCLPPDI